MFLPAPGCCAGGMTPAGACNGAMSTAACLVEGHEAGKAALKALGFARAAAA